MLRRQNGWSTHNNPPVDNLVVHLKQLARGRHNSITLIKVNSALLQFRSGLTFRDRSSRLPLVLLPGIRLWLHLYRLDQSIGESAVRDESKERAQMPAGGEKSEHFHRGFSFIRRPQGGHKVTIIGAAIGAPRPCLLPLAPCP